MTKPKHVATTIQNVLSNPVMEETLNKKSNILEVADVVDGYWTYDLMSRKPSPAEYDDNGNLIKSTNLDLATFLYALQNRGAIINLPTYKRKRAKSVNENQSVISGENRHGKIIGVSSNKDTFSFSVKILDQNVIGTDKDGNDFSGVPRNFNLTDFDGSWYKGWRKLTFLPNQDEVDFLTNNDLWSGLTVTFENFVTPEKWISWFGQYYLITKAMIDRMVDERKHLKKEKARLEEQGIEVPKAAYDEFKEFDSWTHGKSKKDKGVGVRVEKLEVKVDTPEASGDYETYPDTPEGLLAVRRKLKSITKYLERFRFSTRSIEYAVHSQNRFDSFPVWLRDISWEEDYKVSSRSRTKWRRLKLMQPGVGQRSVAIRYRYTQKTQYVDEQVAKEMAAT